MARFARLTTLALLTCSTLAFAGTYVPSDIDKAKGKKVYLLGNSHTDSMREEMCGLAGSSGKEGYMYGTHTIPGAPLRWLWGHPNGSPEHLKSHAWDVVTLQSYNSTSEEEIQAAISYSAAAQEGNPDVHVIMYSIWPSPEDWDNPPLGRREEWNEGVAKRIRKAHPKLKVSVAPTSLIIRRVGDAASEGRIPGLSSRRDLYQDPGHMGPVGAYAIACTILSMIYDESPLGYSPAVLEARGGRPGDDVHYKLEPETARAIQHIVWDTLASYEHDGVDTGLVINSDHLAPGIVGKAYEAALPSAGTKKKVQWQIVKGKLPAGLSLKEGRITGKPESVEEVELTLSAKAGKEEVQRTLTLRIGPDAPLAIGAQDLPARPRRDQYIHQQLRADGAVGRTTWSLADGKLPPGLLLTDAGMLMGTPGARGTFHATLQVADRHPDGPRTALKQVRFEVQPAEGNVLVIPKATAKAKTDGKLDETFWSLDRVLKDNKGRRVGRFDIVWHEEADSSRPERTRCLRIAIQMDPESGAAVSAEALHLYFDLRHNREAIYNQDDLHYVMARNDDANARNDDANACRPYSEEIVQGYKNPRAFREGVVIGKDGTWTIELEISRKLFAGYGVHTEFGPDVTYGFDLAMGSATDPAKRVYLFGSGKSDTNTRAFGSLVIDGK